MENFGDLGLHRNKRSRKKGVGEVKGATVLRAIHLEPIQFDDLMHALLE